MKHTKEFCHLMRERIEAVKNVTRDRLDNGFSILENCKEYDTVQPVLECARYERVKP